MPANIYWQGNCIKNNPFFAYKPQKIVLLPPDSRGTIPVSCPQIWRKTAKKPLLSMRYEREGIYCGDTQTAREEWKREPGSGRIVNTLKPSE